MGQIKTTDKKYIFLDIDGVLNSEEWHQYYWDNDLQYTPYDTEIDYRAARMMCELVNKTGAEIVISSSWRTDMNEVRRRLHNSGLKCPIELRIEGYEFSESDKHPTRGELIERFLSTHPCSTYVIFDDENDMTDEQKDGHFVKTKWKTGITKKDISTAERILSKC